MIANTTTLRAIIDAHGYRWAVAILAWDDQGRAMVATPAGQLVAIHDLTAPFRGLKDLGPEPKDVVDEVAIVTPIFPTERPYIPQDILARVVPVNDSLEDKSKVAPMTLVRRALQQNRSEFYRLEEIVRVRAVAGEVDMLCLQIIRTLTQPIPPLDLVGLARSVSVSSAKVAAAFDELRPGGHLSQLCELSPHIASIVAESEGLSTMS